MRDLGFGISVIHWLTLFQSFLMPKNGNETDILETVNEKEEYKNRLKPCIDKKVVFCQKCRKTIKLSNMGEQTLKCYMKGKKHITNSKPCFFKPSQLLLSKLLKQALMAICLAVLGNLCLHQPIKNKWHWGLIQLILLWIDEKLK